MKLSLEQYYQHLAKPSQMVVLEPTEEPETLAAGLVAASLSEIEKCSPFIKKTIGFGQQTPYSERSHFANQYIKKYINNQEFGDDKAALVQRYYFEILRGKGFEVEFFEQPSEVAPEISEAKYMAQRPKE